MQQLPLQSNPPRSHQTPRPTNNHPKIKPLLQRYYKENQLNESNYQKSLKTHSKTLRAIRTSVDKGRGQSVRYIKGYQKLLKAQDSLSKLSYSFNSYLCFENAYLLSKIRNLKNLTSLDVQFFINIRYIPLKVLFGTLVHLKDLTSFKIELNYYSFTDAETLYILFQSLRFLKNLRNLSLGFKACSNFERAKMKSLPQYLSHLKQLQSLELSFNRSMELTDQDITDLASVFPKLPLLTQISLDFGGQGRVLQGSTLVRVFQKMKNISKVTFNLGDSQVTGQLAEGLRQLDALALRKLSLHFNKNIDTQSLIEISHTIRRCTSLDILHLDLLGCETLTNDGATELGLALSRLTLLSSFKFRVQHRMQADSVIGCIASSLKSLHHLVNLNLDFASNMKSHPDQIQLLAASLSNLTSLKFLNLRLSSLQSLSDNVMEELAETLQKLGRLKHLALDFCYAQKVTKKGVETVINSVRELHGLSFLSLNVAGNEKVDEKTIKKIAQVLKRLPSLYSTNFTFIQCAKLFKQEKGLSSLFSALREMGNLREVFLYITSNEFNEQEVNDLEQRKTLTIDWF